MKGEKMEEGGEWTGPRRGWGEKLGDCKLGNEREETKLHKNEDK